MAEKYTKFYIFPFAMINFQFYSDLFNFSILLIPSFYFEEMDGMNTWTKMSIEQRCFGKSIFKNQITLTLLE